MIGNFARLLTGPPRALEPELETAIDAPPERFTEKISDEGGDVYIAPLVEALRAALKRHREPSTAAPEEEKAVSATKEA